MKFYCSKEELLNAVNNVSKATNAQNGLEILRGIKLEANDGLTLRATNLEISIMCKIETPLLEAADDLGSNSFFKLKKIILPMSVPGIVSGITMVFVPAVSTFYISQKLGGTDTVLIGDLIERLFKQGDNPNLGAALSLVLMALVFVCTGIMSRFGGDEEGGVIV